MSVLIRIAGTVLVLAGLAVIWMPVPLGIVLIPAGLALILATSGAARKWLRRRREDHPRLDRWLLRMERKAPERISKTLRQTDPARSEDGRQS